MIAIRHDLRPADLVPLIDRMWTVSAARIRSLEERWSPSDGAPVFTAAGKYTSRGWTDWTQGFQFGSALLQFEATGDENFLELGRSRTLERMSPHLTHFGVHDHGFNNVSTYGNLLRLSRRGTVEACDWEREFYALALKCSGAVQAKRWTPLETGGFIHSFNGPHSLFADTMRTLRSLAWAHSLGQPLLDEQDRRISLLDRLIHHAKTTADFAVYYGQGRDIYDVRGRVAHESLFNTVSGTYRCPSTQQGYSPFSTWTRGLAWVMLGFVEEIEFLAGMNDSELDAHGGRQAVEDVMLTATLATSDFYIESSPADGIPYWDTGAPGLATLGEDVCRPADPWNAPEPVDSSAAAIAAQALCRLGLHLEKSDLTAGEHYLAAGLTTAARLLDEPYLSVEVGHEGLLLHSVYHQPNGWDYIPDGHSIPCGESSMWGDYHLRELAVFLGSSLDGPQRHTFFA